MTAQDDNGIATASSAAVVKDIKSVVELKSMGTHEDFGMAMDYFWSIVSTSDVEDIYLIAHGHSRGIADSLMHELGVVVMGVSVLGPDNV